MSFFWEKPGDMRTAKLRRIKPELRKRMHDPLSQTGQWLKSIVRGYFNYYAVPGNTASLRRVPASAACALVAYCPSSEPETSDLLDTHGFKADKLEAQGAVLKKLVRSGPRTDRESERELEESKSS